MEQCETLTELASMLDVFKTSIVQSGGLPPGPGSVTAPGTIDILAAGEAMMGVVTVTKNNVPKTEADVDGAPNWRALGMVCWHILRVHPGLFKQFSSDMISGNVC